MIRAGLAAAVDRVVMRLTAPGPAADPVGRRLAALADLERTFHRADWLSDPDSFFAAPGIQPAHRPLGRRWGAEVSDLCWESDYVPLVDESADRYLRFVHNARIRARTFRGGADRPVLVAVHGYGGGNPDLEARIFPVRRWLRRRLNVVLFPLPFHGPRRAPGDKLRFPSAMPAVTVEGFRQAIQDLRGLVGHLLADGAPAVVLTGMSLGGYTTALLATIDARIAFAMPMIPLASLSDYVHGHGRLGGTIDEQEAQRQALQRVYAVVSPLSRPSRLGPERLLVVGATGDRITPMSHAEALAQHLGCELLAIPGGHLVQFGRRRAFAALEARLSALGVLPS